MEVEGQEGHHEVAEAIDQGSTEENPVGSRQ